MLGVAVAMEYVPYLLCLFLVSPASPRTDHCRPLDSYIFLLVETAGCAQHDVMYQTRVDLYGRAWSLLFSRGHGHFCRCIARRADVLDGRTDERTD